MRAGINARGAGDRVETDGAFCFAGGEFGGEALDEGLVDWCGCRRSRNGRTGGRGERSGGRVKVGGRSVAGGKGGAEAGLSGVACERAARIS